MKEPANQKIYKSFTPSITSKLITVQYSLKCFVKHKGWDTFGEGQCITLPIKIFSAPIKEKVPAKELSSSFKVKMEEPVFLGERQVTSEYYEKEMLPKEAEWAANNGIQEGTDKEE